MGEFIELGPEVVAVILLTLAAGWQHARAVDVNATLEVLMTERLRDGACHCAEELSVEADCGAWHGIAI